MTISELLNNTRNIHKNIANVVWGKEKGKVHCKECGREVEVNYAECLEHGWPKCCGYTMSLDKDN
jgi:hypothetical protein